MLNLLLATIGIAALLVCSLGSAIVAGVSMSDEEDREQAIMGRRLILGGGLVFLLVVAFVVFRRLG